ncbi:MAG: XRE family transcriptional regulator [Bacteroidetes bacterium]|jgi:transcriptional regulator with XRE-family HTH domain|nr:MAG: XRE family transcriptional regulator [Bacteroidota bacterium]
MQDHVLLQIGRKIRSVRQAAGVTIQEVADKANVSKGLISKIENGRTVPSLPVLLAIIQALEVGVSVFFDGIEFVHYDGFIHKKPEDHVPIEKEKSTGFLYKLILEQSFTNLAIEIDILELQPDARRELVSTDGYEFLYILEGEIHFVFGDQTIHLEQGHSLFFNGKVLHKPTNRSDRPARFLVFYLLMPSFE